MTTNFDASVMDERAVVVPRFVEPFLEAYQARKSAFLLEHTGDYVVDGGRVAQLDLFVPDLLQREGCQLVVTFSLARGVELYGVLDRGERERQERLLRELSGLRLTGAAGRSDQQPAAALGGTSTDEALRGLDRLLRQPAVKIGVVLYNLERVVQNPSVSGVQMPEQLTAEELVESWGTSAELRATPNIVVGLTRDASKVATPVRNSFAHLAEPLPDRQRLRAFVEQLHINDPEAEVYGRLEEAITDHAFANVATGLRLIDVENIFRRAGAKRQPVSMEAVVAEKAKVVEELADGGLELLEPLRNGFAGLAGVDHVVSDLEDIARLFRERPGSSRLPRAILLLGPPGTGKTSLARALAHESGGVNVVALGEVLGSYVGQSEARMDHVLRLLEGLAPVICFVDEVDTAFVSRGEATGDSGVSKRVLGKILKALGDEHLRGKVLFVLASNRGDLLDAALLRRCQRVYLVSTPGQADRQQILQVLAQRDGRAFAPDIDLATVAERTAGATGADLEKILGRAADIADREEETDEAAIGQLHLLAAMDDYKPNRDPLLHEFFDLVSIRTCPFLSGIPWYRPGSGLNTPDCPDHVRQVLRNDGSIDDAELNHRINQLAMQCAVDRQARQIG